MGWIAQEPSEGRDAIEGNGLCRWIDIYCLFSLTFFVVSPQSSVNSQVEYFLSLMSSVVELTDKAQTEDLHCCL